MTARDAFLSAPTSTENSATNDHLNWLEDEAISILREVFGGFERPAVLCSFGKDSLVVLHLAMKAAAPGKLPLPIVHVDTGHNFPEVISFSEEFVKKRGVQ